MRIACALRTKSVSLSALLAIVFTANAAYGDWTATLTSPPSGGSSNVFIYNLSFNPMFTGGGNFSLLPGDKLTLYDFGAGVTNPSQIQIVGSLPLFASVQPTGLSIPGSLATDNAGINNISFIYD